MNPEGFSPMHGIIALWYGCVADIPSGWALCDGTQGTPDLHGRFVFAQFAAIPPHRTGGAWNHKHAGSVNSHSHYHSGTSSSQDIYHESGSDIGTHPDHLNYADVQTVPEVQLNIDSDAHDHTYTTPVVSHLPPYYSLCYIMKL